MYAGEVTLTVCEDSFFRVFAPWFRSTYKELSVNLWKCVGGNYVTFQL